jgi:hypothetical protein
VKVEKRDHQDLKEDKGRQVQLAIEVLKENGYRFAKHYTL